MSRLSTSLSSAFSGAVLSDDDDDWPEVDGMQDDNSLSNLGSQSVALCCSFLVSSFPETIDALESVCETTSSNN